MGCRFRRSNAIAILAAAAWLSAGAGEAANGALSFSASIDRTTVAINQPLTLTLTLRGDVPRLEQPLEFDMPTPFLVAARSQSTNVSISAGTTQRSISLIYVLVSPEAGTFSLGPFHLNVDGHVMDTETISVVVHKPVVPPGADRQPKVTL